VAKIRQKSGKILENPGKILENPYENPQDLFFKVDFPGFFQICEILKRMVFFVDDCRF